MEAAVESAGDWEWEWSELAATLDLLTVLS